MGVQRAVTAHILPHTFLMYNQRIMTSQALNPRPTEQCVAQMVERVLWEHEVAGSIPVTLTTRY